MEETTSKSLKNLHLETLRGLAATMVVAGHFVGKIPEMEKHKSYLLNFFTNWATESVLIFFILSGIVIHSSFEAKPRSKKSFLTQRFVRLHPILLISVIFTAFINSTVFHQQFSIVQFIGNVVPVSTLNGSLVSVFWKSNPVIWSLSFEMFFYVVFALGAINNNSINYSFIRNWFLVSICSLPLYFLKVNSLLFTYIIQMLAFSGIWIVGFYTWKIRNRFEVTPALAIMSLTALPLVSRLHLSSNYYDPVKYLLFAIIAIPFFIYIIRLNNNYNRCSNKINLLWFLYFLIYLFSIIIIATDPEYTSVIKILYILLPAFSFFVYKILRNIVIIIYYRFFLSIFSYLGRFSYSIYLLHYPLIMLIYYTVSVPLYLKIVVMGFCILISSYFLEKYFQPFAKKTLLRER